MRDKVWKDARLKSIISAENRDSDLLKKVKVFEAPAVETKEEKKEDNVEVPVEETPSVETPVTKAPSVENVEAPVVETKEDETPATDTTQVTE